MSGELRREEPQGWLARRVQAAGEFLSKDVWSADLGALPRLRRLRYKVLRVCYLAIRGFDEDRCLLRAGALTFITGLSIVPLLAFAFSVSKGLGAYQQLLTTINGFLDDALGGSAVASSTESQVQVRAAVDELFELVNTTDLAKLGTFGLGILVYTVIKLLGAIEASFNDIWGVKKSRSLIRKISDYLSIIVIVPVLLVTATGVATAMNSSELMRWIIERLGMDGAAGNNALVRLLRSSSMFFTWIGFSFVYLFLPNTRVRLFSALVGGVVGGVMWQLAQYLHVQFQVGVANYNAIYSTFAALPIFMFWLYVSWITVLLGAEFANAHQSEPAYRQVARARTFDQAFLEVLALRVMTRIATIFLRGEPPRLASHLAGDLSVPDQSLSDVLQRLESGGLVTLAEDDVGRDSRVLPSRDLSHIRVQDVMDAMVGRGEGASVPSEEAGDRALGEALADYMDERQTSARNLSFEAIARRAIEAESGGEVLSTTEAVPAEPGS